MGYAVSRHRAREARALLTIRSKFSSAFLNSSLAELLVLRFDQILEALGKGRHRGFWLLGRCRHGRTFLGTRGLVPHLV